MNKVIRLPIKVYDRPAGKICDLTICSNRVVYNCLQVGYGVQHYVPIGRYRTQIVDTIIVYLAKNTLLLERVFWQ